MTLASHFTSLCVLLVGLFIPFSSLSLTFTSWPYQINSPDLTLDLPPQLREISGLTDISSTKIACVQDELGTVYIYDIQLQQITDEISFTDTGDFEGLTHVDGTLYSLKSDGTLHRIKSFNRKPKIQNYSLELPTLDNEGLCYDPFHHRLLIAPKSKPSKDSGEKRRGIYVFNLRSFKLETDPLFTFDPSEIYAHAEKQGIAVPLERKKNGNGHRTLNFRPSSITVDPSTGNIIVISAEDFGLVIFSSSGEILEYHCLNPNLFSKAEGITFLPNGAMVISNEGLEGNATLLIWNPIKP